MIIDNLQTLNNKALKEGDKLTRSVLTNLIAQIKKQAIDRRCSDNITDELCNEVILKEKKVLQEQIDTCPSTHSLLKLEYEHRMSILEKFAPHIIEDENDIRDIIKSIKETKDIDWSNKGIVMKTVMPILKGKVDLKVANAVIGEFIE